MEFRELANTYGAYDNFITVREAKEQGIIPAVYVDRDDPEGGIFPDRCKCGSENIITRDLKRGTCCNPRCRIKLGYALSEMFSRCGIKGIGDQTCIRMINSIYPELQYKSHVEVLMMEYKDYPYSLYGTVAGQTMFCACQKIRKRQMTFAGMVSLLGVPELSTSTGTLFRGINNAEQMISSIKSYGGIASYCSQRGVNDPEKMFWLYNSLVDIILANSACYNLRPEGIRRIRICITGMVSVGGERMTRNAFVNYCNSIARYDNGVQILEIENTSAKESCAYVVADYPSTSSKYLAGRERGVLITADDFVNKIKEVIRLCMESERMGYTAETVTTMNSF